MKKIALNVDGREMTFTEQELIAIVKEHLSREITNEVTATKVAQKPTEYERFEVKPQAINQKPNEITATKVAQKPTEDEWFEVKPQAIDQKLFEKKRKDKMQEETRQLILEAFAKMKENPKKYGKNFKTMMPKKTWTSKTVAQLKEMASKLGDHNADRVEQALEWAQRIANGESWETICNDEDTANYRRVVVWNENYVKIVGGSVYKNDYLPASFVNISYFGDGYSSSLAVPLVVLTDMKATLQVNGREMTFTEQEPIAIVQENLPRETTNEVTATKVAQKPTEDELFEVKPQAINQKPNEVTVTKVAKKPTVDEWFEVKPHAIDQKLFEKERKDRRQEETRQLILKAFAEMKDNPEKYGKNFKTMIPKMTWKTWTSKTVAQLKEMASKLGDHIADWVEQALEWAQRIANGESWESICNDGDTVTWGRFVKWYAGYYRFVGGTIYPYNTSPASEVSWSIYYDNDCISNTVPLVVLYE